MSKQPLLKHGLFDARIRIYAIDLQCFNAFLSVVFHTIGNSEDRFMKCQSPHL